MLNALQSSTIVLLTVGGSLLFMLVLNRFWTSEKRRAHNDLIGWQLSILGTTYAVILGFMLYTVWTNYGAADLNVDLEANSLLNTYRLAEGLPAQQRSAVKALALAYANAAISQDWPQMADNKTPSATQKINAAMWAAVTAVQTASPTENTAEDHVLTELGQLTEHSRTRLLQSNSTLPPILWFVLVVGAIVTVISATTFGSLNLLLHTMQVISFSLLISLVLVAIADIDRPFQGAVHVSSYAFERTRQSMQDTSPR